jgi:hypothetical protein
MCCMLSEKPAVPAVPKPFVSAKEQHVEDEPLPATLTFVLTLGVSFAVLWFGVFLLLRARW